MRDMPYSNLQIFAAELVGTFILVVLATGSIVYDARAGHGYGLWIAAAGPFLALIVGVYSFGRISLAHFNPAVTMAYYITGHARRAQIPWYVAAELAGALLGSLFVMLVVGIYGGSDDGGTNLGANAPNPDLLPPVIFLFEVLASALLMGVILVVVYKRKLKNFSGVAIGGVVALDILLIGSISGASMNPTRSLAPALLSGATGDLWLYLTAPFVGTATAAALVRLGIGRQQA